MANQGPPDSGGVEAEERLHQISCGLSTVYARLRRARKRVAQRDHVLASYGNQLVLLRCSLVQM